MIVANMNHFEEIIDKMMIEGFDPEFQDKIMSLPVHDKRLAILSLLDRDRNLFMKIKSYISSDKLTKIDHLKDVILMLRQYVKVGEVEKKKFGEVMTPLELVKEMLATLPEDVWTNPNLKWLDPANGTGPYPLMVIYKLMKGLEEWEPNEEKRYKHIVENMIYVCELQPKNMFLYMCLIDPYDEYNLNIYTGSFLDKDFDNHMKEIWGVDKFDVIVGNPPYNSNNKKNLYIDFFEKSFNILRKSGVLTFITPSRYVIQPEFSDFRKNTEKITKKVTLINTGRAFGESASFSTIYVTIFMGEGCSIDWLSGYDNSIVRKVLTNGKNFLQTKRSKSILKNKEERDSYSDNELTNHYKYFVNSKGNCQTPFRYLPFKIQETFTPKVYMTEFVGTGSSKRLGNIYIDELGQVGLGTDSCMYIECNDVERLNSLKVFLSSKLINYVLNEICQSSHANQTMRLIPDPTVENKFINECEILKYFNLTEKEISIINSYMS